MAEHHDIAIDAHPFGWHPKEREEFLMGLAALVHGFLEAEAAGALTTLEQLALRLESRAAELGIARILALARSVRAACATSDAERVSEALSELAREAAVDRQRSL